MNRNNKQMFGAMLLLAVVLLAFGAVFTTADPAAPETLSTVSSSSRDTSQISAKTAEAQGGNVSNVNLDALLVTSTWAGFYGDITGQLVLGDANNNTFYNWSIVSVDGQVYATRASSITWDNVRCINATNITNESTYLGVVSSDSDSIQNTFTTRSHPSFAVTTSNTVSANTCNSTNVFARNNSQTANWTQVLLWEGFGANVVYSTITNQSTVGFDGNTYDFQLLVGENEKTGQTGVTNYYFWVQFE